MNPKIWDESNIVPKKLLIFSRLQLLFLGRTLQSMFLQNISNGIFKNSAGIHHWTPSSETCFCVCCCGFFPPK